MATLYDARGQQGVCLSPPPSSEQNNRGGMRDVPGDLYVASQQQTRQQMPSSVAAPGSSNGDHHHYYCHDPSGGGAAARVSRDDYNHGHHQQYYHHSNPGGGEEPPSSSSSAASDHNDYYSQEYAARHAADEQASLNYNGSSGHRGRWGGRGVVYDVEEGRGGGGLRDAWAEEKLRRATEHGFIRKVYGIVGAQLFITFLVSLAFMTITQLQIFVLDNEFPIAMMSTVVTICLVCALVCNRALLRTYPWNYICLFAFTVAESVSVGLVCLFSGTWLVLQAVIAVVVIFVVLTLFAFQTKYDFTSWMFGLLLVTTGFLAFGILKALFFRSPTLNLIYAVCGAAIFSIYIIVDTQLMMSRSEFSLDRDDYILAALNLYLDFIWMFFHILELLRECSQNAS